MNRRYILLVLLLFIIPITSAWTWGTHQTLVEKLYSDMPREFQTKLNLSLMKEGSIAPDKVFHDNVFHHYPPSYNLTLEWLNKGGSYEEISYNIGVVAHYISDSFAAPHYISKEDYKDHSKFEKSVENYIPKTKCYNYKINLKEGLEEGSLNYKDWGEWLLTKDKDIAQKEVDQSMKLIYSVMIEKFKFECNKKTSLEYVKDYFNLNVFYKLLLFFLVLLLVYIFYSIIKRFKYKK